MLQLSNLSKTYVSKKNVKCFAVKGANASFNEEIVSILGSSGSGKTTLLNLIGAFDRYDKGGEIVIDGVSTNDFKDKDWDDYRNYKIGYIFQDYNLIDQLTVIENVSIGLGFSHMSIKMRKKLSERALREVGLIDHKNKYPNELSGGQMQCVAIARAIAKNPDIILADEPTGSLDTETSKHIMDVLKKVAKGKTLIIATHNNKLAEQYSDRIMHLEDGRLSSFDDLAETAKVSVVNKKLSSSKILDKNNVAYKKAGLSLSSAVSMAFSSFRYKKLKTAAMLFAGCIGVFLVATILSVSNGLNLYVDGVQNTTLAQYPIVFGQQRDLTKVDSYVKVQKQIADNEHKEALTKSELRNKVLEEAKKEKRVALNNIIGSMMSTSGESTSASSISTVNDLYSFKEYLDSNPQDINNSLADIEYSFRTSPVIYTNNSNGAKEVYPSNSMFGSLGTGSGKTSISGSSSKQGSSSISYNNDVGPLPKNADIYKDDESLVAGHWPEGPLDAILVLHTNGTIDDTLLYDLGMRDFNSEIAPLIEKYYKNEKVDYPGQLDTYAYTEFLGRTLKVINPSDCYKQFEGGKWLDMTGDPDYMKNVLNNAKDLKICGVVLPRDGSRSSAYLNPGIRFTQELNELSINMTKDSALVQAQLNNPDTDVLTGEKFSYLAASKNVFSRLNGKKLVNVDLDMIAKAFKINPEALNLKLPKNKAQKQMTEKEMIDLIVKILEDPETQEWIHDITKDGEYEAYVAKYLTLFASEYSKYAQDCIEHHKTPISSEMWLKYSEEGKHIYEMAKEEIPEAMLADVINYLEKWGPRIIEQFLTEFEAEVKQIFNDLIELLSDDSGPNLVEFNADAFSKIVGVHITMDDIKQIMYNITGSSEHTYKGNLADFGYDDMKEPTSVTIYPKDFNSKQKVIEVVEGYNSEMIASNQESKFVTYTDDASTLVNVAQAMIKIIAGIIVFFVSSVFVTSTILIGVIFGLSTVQRRREIGILRALGARKRDVSRMFNVESALIGALAGILGVVLSLLVCMLINAVIPSEFSVAVMPFGTAIFLIIFSAVLILIAGFVPSKVASRKDPVKAIRGL